MICRYKFDNRQGYRIKVNDGNDFVFSLSKNQNNILLWGS